MKELLNSLFGSYIPPTYEIVEGEQIFNVIPSGAAGVDWEFVLGVLLFIVVLYSFFRILGSLFGR